MVENDVEKQQMQFYEKVANYIGRHPEFIEELQKRMDEEELTENKNNYASKEESKEQNKEQKSKKGFLKLDDERIITISEELSGLLFVRDKSNKSVLEKTVQEAFSSVVKNYLSKYVG